MPVAPSEWCGVTPLWQAQGCKKKSCCVVSCVYPHPQVNCTSGSLLILEGPRSALVEEAEWV